MRTLSQVRDWGCIRRTKLPVIRIIVILRVFTLQGSNDAAICDCTVQGATI
jgi:hypothetical protein